VSASPSPATVSRRSFLGRAAVAVAAIAAPAPLRASPRPEEGFDAGLAPLAPVAGNVRTYDLSIAEARLRLDGRAARAVAINGSVPGPVLRFREGEEAVLRVHNAQREDTSVHWHGLLLPPEMDGVPGLSFPGIRPGETFEYRFPIRQAGTYWYHSHSGLQAQLGHYGALVIEPTARSGPAYDREHVVVLSDWTFEDPRRVLSRLKKQPDAYNYQRRTVVDFFRDVARDGWSATVNDRMMWAGMRMNPTDIADVTGATYSYLLNGRTAEEPWTGQFVPGERVLLRLINGSAGTYFDVRIPGVRMTVVEVSGQPVEPVEVDELRIAIAETYDVIVELPEDRAYALYAETMDRSGFTAGRLATREGARAELPPRRRRPLLTMSDMGMAHGAMGHVAPPAAAAGDAHASHDQHAGHGATAAAGASSLRAPGTRPPDLPHGPASHGTGNQMVPTTLMSRLHEPGMGLGGDGRRVLVYTDLRARTPREDFAAPTREIELHLTGNMERYLWSIDGVAYDRVSPITLAYGERVRLMLVNDTMMNHPMHLHGLWMELENGHGARCPRVHTVNVKPAEQLSLLVTADAPGRWAFHCHVLYHMEVGMFREVHVGARPVAHDGHHHGA
jgi:CopA family copper-resistance protein